MTGNMQIWANVRTRFDLAEDGDGSGRIIHVPGTNSSDWQRMLAALPRSAWRWTYKYDDKITALPVSFSASLQEQGYPSLVVDGEQLGLRCNFYQLDDIEYFVETASVQHEQAFERLVTFMRWLCDVVEKPVLLSHEFADDPTRDPIVRIVPETNR
jgi:hypothetical protein